MSFDRTPDDLDSMQLKRRPDKYDEFQLFFLYKNGVWHEIVLSTRQLKDLSDLILSSFMS